jgi:hypothetical protein
MGNRIKSANSVIESGLIYGYDPADASKANNPYVSPEGALYVFDLASTGFDPSIGYFCRCVTRSGTNLSMWINGVFIETKTATTATASVGVVFSR